MSGPLQEFEKRLLSRLDARKEAGTLRSLRSAAGLVDLNSNDYLGLARDPRLIMAIRVLEEMNDQLPVGSTASRLLAGNSPLAEDTESIIARFHQTESALFFNSGYDANVGLYAALGRAYGAIVYDELIHASVHDGMRLSKARCFPFRHNDPQNLQEVLNRMDGPAVVAVEGIYSMDGTICNLSEILEVCERHNAILSVDEAHSAGVLGPNGGGLVQQMGLEQRVAVRLVTYGKAFGCHGAAVVGSSTLRQYLINYARPLMYSTFATNHTLLAVQAAYTLMPHLGPERERLAQLISSFNLMVKVSGISGAMKSRTAIQSIVIPGNEAVRNAAGALQRAGFDARPIVSPTVPVGTERIRICLHAFNTVDELVRFISSLHTALNN
jgi:8-amino-7-oxononanoate synthase